MLFYFYAMKPKHGRQAQFTKEIKGNSMCNITSSESFCSLPWSHSLKLNTKMSYRFLDFTTCVQDIEKLLVSFQRPLLESVTLSPSQFMLRHWTTSFRPLSHLHCFTEAITMQGVNRAEGTQWLKPGCHMELEMRVLTCTKCLDKMTCRLGRFSSPRVVNLKDTCRNTEREGGEGFTGIYLD